MSEEQPEVAENRPEDGVIQWINQIERLKVKLALAVFLVLGIFIHFIIVFYTEEGFHFFSFIEKTADAIVIAAVIGITYEWYASQSRHKALQKEIEDIVRREERELRMEVNKVRATLEALADENTAAFNIISPSQIEEELREKIEVCNKVLCMGDFHVRENGHETDLFEDIAEYTGNNLERYIHKRILTKEDEFELFRIYPHQDEDDSWVEEHKQLFEFINDEDSSDYELVPHPHSVEYPLPCFMVIDDDNTPGGDLLVLAVPEKEGIGDEFQKQILLYTEDETAINAFENYFADIWDQSRALTSSDEFGKIEQQADD